MRFRGEVAGDSVACGAAGGRGTAVSGPYLGAGAGYNLPENHPLEGGGKIEPGGGFVGLGSVGYGLGNGFRFELEGNYREAPLPAISNAEVSSNSGNLHTYGVMANVLYDLDIGVPWLFPYLGGGVGYAWDQFLADPRVHHCRFPGDRRDVSTQTEGSFAFQAIGGLSFPHATAARAGR